MMHVADLHCDLLSYLAQDARRTIDDEEVRCSLKQLTQGSVYFQTLAIFTETVEGGVSSARKQFELFCKLPKIYPKAFERLIDKTLLAPKDKIYIAAAIENASGLCNESEPLLSCFSRLDNYMKTAGPILYVSLTWNQENRFGGGNLTNVGLKRDGELLLEYLDGKGIAVDLSHTSDALAEEILTYIDKKNLRLIPIASHSNFRAVCNQLRNLKDEIAKEIVKRGGIIGLNFFRPFLGVNGEEDLRRQVEYARSLGAFDHYCFGADFFYDKDLSQCLYPSPFYYERFSNAGCYPNVISYLKNSFSFEELEKMAYKNLNAFYLRVCL
jgi:membrane dipeptidase